MKQEITDTTFKEETAKGTVIVDFWATWCGPCRMQAPILDQLSDEFDEDEVKFLAMDVDENPVTPQSFDVMAIPTLLFMKDGEVIRQEAGVHSKAQIKQILQEIN